MSKKLNKKFLSAPAVSKDKVGLGIPKSIGNKFAVLNMDDDLSDAEIKSPKQDKEVEEIEEVEVEEVEKEKKVINVTKPSTNNKASKFSKPKKNDGNVFTHKKVLDEVLEGLDDMEWQTSKHIKHKKWLEKETDDKEDRSVNKQLYIEEDWGTDDNLFGNKLYLNSSWTVWRHASDCDIWTEDSYTNIYVINSIGSFWRFFNNFHLLDKVKNQLFIMRGKIKPIWEDNDNRKGGICSIKLDCFNRQGKIDMGTDVMICICLLIMNETFLTNNSEINGISYSIKNKSVLIKIWCKNYNINVTEKLPISFFNKLDTILRGMDKHSFGKRPENKISIRYTQIQPEYDINA